MANEVELSLKEASEREAASLLTMLIQAKEETDFFIVDEKALRLPEEQLATELMRIKESEEHLLFLACQNEQVIGVVSVSPTHDQLSYGEIGISILKDYWGMGLGTILLEEAVLWAEGNDRFTALTLEVKPHNQRAIHLYQKMGFSIEKATDDFLVTNSQRVTTIKMKRIL